MSTYLVTGGAGFIGSHLVEALLADGHAVRILDDLSTGKEDNLPAGADLTIGSVTDHALVAQLMEGVSGCFHLAAVSSVARCTADWPGTHAINSGGAVAVFDAARARGERAAIPVVYASSAAVYGASQALPLSENTPPDPISAYGADKFTTELHGRIAATIHGVPNTGLRFFNVFGPRQDPASAYSGVISIFSHRLKQGLPLVIHGDGTQTRDFVHVGDAVEALRRAMYAGPAAATVCNVCTGLGTSLLQLADTLGRSAGLPPAIEFAPARAGDISHSVGDGRRAKSLLGIQPLSRLEVAYYYK